MDFCKLHRTFAGIAALGVAYMPAKASACGLALLFAMDVSLSVDEAEYLLQSRGMAMALQREDVQHVIGAVPGGVVLSVLPWSGSSEQFLTLPWTLVSDPTEINSLATKIAAMPRMFVGDTAHGSALEYVCLILAEVFQGMPKSRQSGFEGFHTGAGSSNSSARSFSG